LNAGGTPCDVEKIVVHKDYDSDTIEHDIAIWKVQATLRNNRFFKQKPFLNLAWHHLES
jgi:hypothetical protein